MCHMECSDESVDGEDRKITAYVFISSQSVTITSDARLCQNNKLYT